MARETNSLIPSFVATATLGPSGVRTLATRTDQAEKRLTLPLT